MNSTREDILLQLELQLKSWTENPDNQTSIQTVNRLRYATMEQVQNSTAQCMQLDFGDEVVTIRDKEHQRHEANMTMRLFARWPNDHESAMAQLNAAQGDIRRFCDKNIFTHANVLIFRYLNSEGLESYEQGDLVFIDMKCRLVYWTTKETL